jgi:hypothetical protein
MLLFSEFSAVFFINLFDFEYFELIKTGVHTHVYILQHIDRICRFGNSTPGGE